MYNKRELKKTEKKQDKRNPFSRDIIYDPRGQWDNPGENTRIPGGNITMQGVPYPVYGVPYTNGTKGQGVMMQPGQDYIFKDKNGKLADYVDEFPKMQQPSHQMPDGTWMLDEDHEEYKEVDLTDEEIQAYRDGGYVVEEYPHGGEHGGNKRRKERKLKNILKNPSSESTGLSEEDKQRLKQTKSIVKKMESLPKNDPRYLEYASELESVQSSNQEEQDKYNEALSDPNYRSKLNLYNWSELPYSQRQRTEPGFNLAGRKSSDLDDEIEGVVTNRLNSRLLNQEELKAYRSKFGLVGDSGDFGSKKYTFEFNDPNEWTERTRDLRSELDGDVNNDWNFNSFRKNKAGNRSHNREPVLSRFTDVINKYPPSSYISDLQRRPMVYIPSIERKKIGSGSWKMIDNTGVLDESRFDRELVKKYYPAYFQNDWALSDLEDMKKDPKIGSIETQIRSPYWNIQPKWSEPEAPENPTILPMPDDTFIGQDPINRVTSKYSPAVNKWSKHVSPIGGAEDDLQQDREEWQRQNQQGRKRRLGMTFNKGGEVMELTDKEIAEYEKGGYVVEELPRAQDGYNVKQRRGVRNNYDNKAWTPSGLQFPTSVSSHLMKAEYDDNIDESTGKPVGWVGFPSLFQDDKPYANDQDNWVQTSEDKGWGPIYEEAKRRGEVYYFGEDKEAALAFGMGSWKDQLPEQQSGGALSRFITKAQDGGEIQEQGGYEYKKDGDKYLTRKKGSENWIESSGKALASIKYKIYGEGEDPKTPAEKEAAIINRMRSTFHAEDDEMFWSTEYEKLSPKEQQIHDYSSQLKRGDITHDPKSSKGKAFETYIKKVASPEAWMKLMPQTMGQVFDSSNDPNKFKSIKKSWGNITPEQIEITQDRGSSFDGLTNEDVEFANSQSNYMQNVYDDAEVKSTEYNDFAKQKQSQEREQTRWETGVDPITGNVMPQWEIEGVSRDQYYEDFHKDPAVEMLNASGLPALNEFTSIPAAARIWDDPKGTWDGIKQTGQDIGINHSGMRGANSWTGGGINPLTGKEYWSGADRALDALMVTGPLLGSASKVRTLTKPFVNKNLVSKYGLGNIPSFKALKQTDLSKRLDDVDLWKTYSGQKKGGWRGRLIDESEKYEIALTQKRQKAILNKQEKANDKYKRTKEYKRLLNEEKQRIAGKPYSFERTVMGPKERALERKFDAEFKNEAKLIPDKYEELRLKYSGLPIEFTGMQGGFGRIYNNLLNKDEYIKFGQFPGATKQDLEKLVEIGEDLNKTGNFNNVAFPTKYLEIQPYAPIRGSSVGVQHMPKIPKSTGQGRGSVSETADFLKQVRRLDDEGIGIDYRGRDNIMYNKAHGQYGVVDINYVGAPGSRTPRAQDFNLLNLTPKQRLSDKFGSKLLNAADQQKKDGGEIMDLTDFEIEQYKRNGHVVEELPRAQNGIPPEPPKKVDEVDEGDSTLLYYNSIALDKWMKDNNYSWDDKPYQKSKAVDGNDFLGHLRSNYAMDKGYNTDYNLGNSSGVNFGRARDFGDYVKQKGQMVGASDWYSGGGDDYGLPITWRHPLIDPQREGDMKSIKDENAPQSYSFRYDPTMIKPYNDTTEEEKEYRRNYDPNKSFKPIGTLDPNKSINVNLIKQGFATNTKTANAFKKKLWEEVYPDTPYKATDNAAQNIKLNKWILDNEDKLSVFNEKGTLVEPKYAYKNQTVIGLDGKRSIKKVPYAVNYGKGKGYESMNTPGVIDERLKELTDAEITEYKNGGYVVEELPKAQNGIPPGWKQNPDGSWTQMADDYVAPTEPELPIVTFHKKKLAKEAAAKKEEHLNNILKIKYDPVLNNPAYTQTPSETTQHVAQSYIGGPDLKTVSNQALLKQRQDAEKKEAVAQHYYSKIHEHNPSFTIEQAREQVNDPGYQHKPQEIGWGEMFNPSGTAKLASNIGSYLSNTNTGGFAWEDYYKREGLGKNWSPDRMKGFTDAEWEAEHGEQSWDEKFKDIAFNPFTAAGFWARGQEVPDHMQRDIDRGTFGYYVNGQHRTDRSLLDVVTDVSPLGGIHSATRILDKATNDIDGDFWTKETGFDAINTVFHANMLRNALKMKKLGSYSDDIMKSTTRKNATDPDLLNLGYNPLQKALGTTDEISNFVNNPRAFSPQTKLLQRPAAPAKPTWSLTEPSTNTLQIKSTMKGSPFEKQLSKTGMISVNNINAHINKQGVSTQDKYILQQTLDKVFPGQTKIDYNEFKAAVSNQIVPLEKTFSGEYANIGLERIGYDKNHLTRGNNFQETNPNIAVWNKRINDDVQRNASNNIRINEINNRLKDPNLNPSEVPALEKQKTAIAEQIKYASDRIDEFQAMIDEIPAVKDANEVLYTQTIKYGNEADFGRGVVDHFKDAPLGWGRMLVTKSEPDVAHWMETQSDYYQDSAATKGEYYKNKSLTEDELKTKLNRNVENSQKEVKKIQTELDELKSTYFRRNTSESTETEPGMFLDKDGFMRDSGSMEDGLRHTDFFIDGAKQRLNKSKIALDNSKSDLKNAFQKQLLGKTHEARLLQENILHSVKQGQTKMRYPTKETAAKIQGYRTYDVEEIVDKNVLTDLEEIGLPYSNGVNSDKSGVISDISYIETHLDKYPNVNLEKLKKAKSKIENDPSVFSTTKKYKSKHQTILNKYKKAPKMIKKTLGVDTKVVTDPKGNTWYEFDIPESALSGKYEMQAFSKSKNTGVETPTKGFDSSSTYEKNLNAALSGEKFTTDWMSSPIIQDRVSKGNKELLSEFPDIIPSQFTFNSTFRSMLDESPDLNYFERLLAQDHPEKFKELLDNARKNPSMYDYEYAKNPFKTAWVHELDNQGFVKVSANPYAQKPIQAKQIGAHEKMHQFQNSRMKSKPYQYGKAPDYSIREKELLTKPFKKLNVSIFNDIKHENYLAKLVERHARIQEVRANLNLKPEDVFKESMIESIKKSVPQLYDRIEDKKEFVKTMNEMWILAPALIGAGAAAIDNYSRGGELNKFIPKAQNGFNQSSSVVPSQGSTNTLVAKEPVVEPVPIPTQQEKWQATMDWFNTHPYEDMPKWKKMNPLAGSLAPSISKSGKLHIPYGGNFNAYDPENPNATNIYEQVKQPDDYIGLDILRVNGKPMVTNKDFNKEYLKTYSQKKLVNNEIFHIYGQGLPYDPSLLKSYQEKYPSMISPELQNGGQYLQKFMPEYREVELSISEIENLRGQGYIVEEL